MTALATSQVQGYSLDTVRQLIAAADSTLWLGAASFEERCIGAMAALSANQITLSQGFVLDYSTNLGRDPDADRRRQLHQSLLGTLGARVVLGSLLRHPVDAYSFGDFAAFVRGVLTRAPATLAVIDITCLTKIHALALATELAYLPSDRKWLLAYTLPENYGGPDSEKVEGWRDVIIAPLAQSARLSNEEYSRGIILLGHEADRLVFALSELEPSGGIIVHVDTPRRPDWKVRSAAVNRRSIRRLTGMRFAEWSTVSIDSTNYARIASLVESQIDAARHHDAPMILFPFGPKSLIVTVSLQLVTHYGEGAWFVYPVPQEYDKTYTEGVGQTRWFGSA
jgi:hypothetical protein